MSPSPTLRQALMLATSVGVVAVMAGCRSTPMPVPPEPNPVAPSASSQSSAPEVIAEIERTVRLAEPYPAPVRIGRVTYTDTWLWHSSGLFQLDTLTEGQY